MRPNEVEWSGCRESNPVYMHPMHAYYRYTTARLKRDREPLYLPGSICATVKQHPSGGRGKEAGREALLRRGGELRSALTSRAGELLRLRLHALRAGANAAARRETEPLEVRILSLFWRRVEVPAELHERAAHNRTLPADGTPLHSRAILRPVARACQSVGLCGSVETR